MAKNPHPKHDTMTIVCGCGHYQSGGVALRGHVRGDQPHLPEKDRDRCDLPGRSV